MKMMEKKSLVVLVTAGALLAPLMAQASDDVEVSGFIDVIVNTDSGAEGATMVMVAIIDDLGFYPALVARVRSRPRWW